MIPTSIIQWGSGPLWILLDLQCRILTKFIPIVVAFESPLRLSLLLFIFMACLCLCLPIVYILNFVLQSWSYTYAAIFFHRRNNGSMPCGFKPAVQLNFKLQHFPIRQLPGSDRSETQSFSIGWSNILPVIWPTINKKVSTLADLKLHCDLKFGHFTLNVFAQIHQSSCFHQWSHRHQNNVI